MSTNTRARDNETSILARVLANDQDKFSPELARYIRDIEFSDRDKARMHELAIRNQNGELSPPERDELFAYAKAGTILSILQVKAKRSLKIKVKKRSR